MTLEQLFEQHHASLFRFIAGVTNDPELAKDIVQDTFMALATRSEPVPSRAWLFQSARNLARSSLRKRKRRLLLLQSRSDGLPVAAPSAPPDIGLERSEKRAAVRRALAGLTEKERSILLMREEGFAHREIAQAVGTTTGSVGTMFARAMAKLERALDDVWKESQ
jgi:RNA polymerase sigma-70 factor (ECF subfamily)